jgi:hypothetical protein
MDCRLPKGVCRRVSYDPAYDAPAKSVWDTDTVICVLDPNPES